jgi:hypothetical protein
MRSAKELGRTSRVKVKPSGKPVGPPDTHRGERSDRMVVVDKEV